MRVLGLSRTGHLRLPSGGISGHARDPKLWVEGVVATVLSGGISGHARDPFPPSAEGLSHTGRWPHESVSAPGPVAAILLTADNLCEQGLSVLFVYVHCY
jgi:hypothetical protein